MNTVNRFVFLKLRNSRQGIFRVVGGRRGVKRGWPKGAKLKAVHDLTSQSVVIPATPWLKPAFDQVIPQLPTFYKKALTFQLKRFGLFDRLR